MSNLLYDSLFAPHEGRETPFLYLPDGRTVTHANFLDDASRYANALTALGVSPGGRVAVQVNKSPHALALYASCVMAGAVFLPLNIDYKSGELEYFFTDADVALFICDPGEAEQLRVIADRAGCALHTLGADGLGSLTDLASEQDKTFTVVARQADDLAALLYTSGTTGRSKGAMLTHRNLASNAEALTELWRFTDDDVLLHALPIFHVHGLFVAVNVSLMAGGAMIFLPKFDLDAVLNALPQATAMMGVPTFYTRLLDDPRFTQDLAKYMRIFISGSAPLAPETHVQFEARTGHRILERYGMTETGMNTSNPLEGERRAGSVGLPLPNVEVKVRDPETGADLPPGETGVLEVRGPNVFPGYWRMPEKTREELREDGFFITGDLATIGSDGYVAIVGRQKDLIISGGYNIYPKEIELFLNAQPGVSESAVIGAPHPDFGESAVAVLVPDPGVEIDLKAIEEAARRELAGFKRPRCFEIVPTLPRNVMGKVQKAELRERFAHAFQTAKG